MSASKKRNASVAHITPPSTRITRSRAAKSLPPVVVLEIPEKEPLKVEYGVKEEEEESNGITVVESDTPVLDVSDEKPSIMKKMSSSSSDVSTKKALKNEVPKKGGRVPLAGSNGKHDEESQFVGEKLSDEVAKKKWPERYPTVINMFSFSIVTYNIMHSRTQGNICLSD